MLGNLFTYTFHVASVMVADGYIFYTLPIAAQLIHVSAVGSNGNNGLMTIGNSDTAAAYLASASIGDSGTPVEFSQANFVGAQFPHIAKGTIVKVVLDHDGAGGVATADFTLVLTFLEG